MMYLYMHPMTFYEYLLALGKETVAEYTRQAPETVAESIQQAVLTELRQYFFIGGMPECVKTFRDSGSILASFQVQSV
ncbi:hypothetical protein [Candidatus Electrothrix sp.]|uniref:hypothetical protein n=1 Tax=Candidatus Electrothrix sp. TaxID=2170559 RepID=UPI004056AE6A